MGYDCSPASALIALGLRQRALPFDWVVLTIPALERCFQDKFQSFHCNLVYGLDPSKTTNGTFLTDVYGIRFLHDYPMEGERIAFDWWNSYTKVYEKYRRRIQRFLDMVRDKANPLVILCRYSPEDTVKLKELFKTYFGREDVKIVSATWGAIDDPDIVIINAEAGGNWNETKFWKEGLDKVLGR